MNSIQWLRQVAPEAANGAIAARAGLTRSTLNRQIAQGELKPEVVVAVARAYGKPVLEGLVSCGFITEKEAALKERMGLEEVLAAATDEQLLRAILDRVGADGQVHHPLFDEPLDSEHIPTMMGAREERRRRLTADAQPTEWAAREGEILHPADPDSA
ncbi:hypothetical protein GCM10009785_02190 [Brooklawnia cerclae]|uniref:XRE family transcriptional regulator n=1 Tax=Brooklawnia cerclae TaxID=349934 RepID=A0ABX0SCR7_9ACTN|nr:hypothetical protein [Brooklawnia cerclae]NIH56187.1 hypothetical protein [Brooklawnia cerclae]